MIKAFEAKELMIEMKDKEIHDDDISTIADSLIEEAIKNDDIINLLNSIIEKEAKRAKSMLIIEKNNPLLVAVKNSDTIISKLTKSGYGIVFRKETSNLEIQWGSSSRFKQGYYTEF